MIVDCGGWRTGGDDVDRGRWSGLRVEGGSEYTVDLGCVGIDMALLNGLLMDRSYMMLFGVCRKDGRPPYVHRRGFATHMN